MKRLKAFWNDFKKFISKGNILDLAVALVVGNAFTKIVQSLVNDLIMPLICAIFGSATVNDLHWTLNGAEIYYGKFLQAVIDFLLVAFVLFLVLRIVMNARKSIEGTFKAYPTRAEKKQLKAQTKSKNRPYKEVLKEHEEKKAKELEEQKLAKELEEKKQAEEYALAHPSSETLLAEIRDLLKDAKKKKYYSPQKKTLFIQGLFFYILIPSASLEVLATDTRTSNLLKDSLYLSCCLESSATPLI